MTSTFLEWNNGHSYTLYNDQYVKSTPKNMNKNVIYIYVICVSAKLYSGGEHFVHVFFMNTWN